MHLTLQQLSAHLDEALQGASLQTVERHLAACEACRDELAALTMQDDVLSMVLRGESDDLLFELITLQVRCAIHPQKARELQKKLKPIELARAELRLRAETQALRDDDARRAGLDELGQALSGADSPAAPGTTYTAPTSGFEATDSRGGSVGHQRRAIEEARGKAEAEARALALEAKRAREEAEHRALEEAGARARGGREARRRREEEERLKAEAQARTRLETEARARAEAEARQQAEDEARRRAEAEAIRHVEAEARAKAEEDLRRRTAEIRRRAEEAARQRAAEEARERAEEAARARAEEEARLRAVEEARLLAEAQARARVLAATRAEADALATAAAAAMAEAESSARDAALARARAEARAAAADLARREAESKADEAARLAVVPPTIAGSSGVTPSVPASEQAQEEADDVFLPVTLDARHGGVTPRGPRHPGARPREGARRRRSSFPLAAAAALLLVAFVGWFLIQHRDLLSMGKAEPAAQAMIRPDPTPTIPATGETSEAPPEQEPPSAPPAELPVAAVSSEPHVATRPAPVHRSTPSEPQTESPSGDASGSATVVPITRHTSVTAASTAPAPETGLLCGDVRDERGQPVAGARIMVADAGLAVVTDRGGRFCFAVPKGDHVLSVLAIGFHTQKRDVNIGKQSDDLVITLHTSSPAPGDSTH